MNKAEARVYLSAHPKLLGLRGLCRFDGQTLSGFDPCPGCGARYGKPPHLGVARDWHLEDLLEAMETAGWKWEAARAREWRFSRWLSGPGRPIWVLDLNPFIAAALALQQEARQRPPSGVGED